MDDPLYLLTDSTGHRAFCETRYESSRDLATRFRDVVQQGSHCYRLDTEGDYLHIHDSRQQNKFAGWYILFKFDTPKESETAAVRVSITSYHYRQQKPQNLRWTMPSKFQAFLARWLSTRDKNLTLCEEVPAEDKEKPA